MTDHRYRFKPVERRNDIGDIKSRCYQTSKQTTDDKSRWRTNYRDNYHAYPLDQVSKADPPTSGLRLGGGNLEPTREEMRSCYANEFRQHADARPQTAKPVPNSRLFEYNFPIPKSTMQEANDEVCGNLPKYDTAEMKTRQKEGTGCHFQLGTESGNGSTQYGSDFRRYPDVKRGTIDLRLQQSSVALDTEAGYGPHTRQRGHHQQVPEKPDADKPDHQKLNYDVGYGGTNYRTTMKDAFPENRKNARPHAYGAPTCATLSDHGDAAPVWGSTYRSDFHDRKRIANDGDTEDLRRTHFDLGHTEGDWSRRQQATTARKPKLEHVNMQISNQVFKGDGTGRYDTTAGDLLGKYDRNAKAAYDQSADARADHLRVGSDELTYETTASVANRCAGKGRPATACADLHLMKGGTFARGGAWDPFVGKDMVSEKKYRRVQQPEKMGGAYFKQSHFDLEATGKNKNRYKTEYFEGICRPKVQP